MGKTDGKSMGIFYGADFRWNSLDCLWSGVFQYVGPMTRFCHWTDG